MKKILTIFFFVFILLGINGDAYGWSGNASNDPVHRGSRTFDRDSTNCQYCHPAGNYHTSGPHGNYTATTDFCKICHQVHNSKNRSLLRMGAETATDVCLYCHDLTQSKYAPYSFYDSGSVTASVYAAHRVPGIILPHDYVNALGEQVSGGRDYVLSGFIVPGGSETDGGLGYFDGSRQGKLSGNSLSCFSCHSVHAVAGSMIKPYLGESQTKVAVEESGHEKKLYLTSRLLRNRPDVTGAYVYEYGAQWCMACHKGRGGTLMVGFNHPVNNEGYGYDFLNNLQESEYVFPGGKEAALLDIIEKKYVIVDDGLENGTMEGAHIRKEPRNNAWYTMVLKDAISGADRPDGNTTYSIGGPSCQQCHANPRDVERAFAIGGVDENPLRMSFPHVSRNQGMLVETLDDLCTNCHGLVNLP